MVIAALAAGWTGVPYLLAVLVVVPLAWLQRSVVGVARDDRDARRAHALLLMLQLAVAGALAYASPNVGTLAFMFSGALNMVPLVANGLRMPIVSPTSHPCYCEIGDGTRFSWLGDRYPTTRTARAQWLLSIGDVIEILSIWTMAALLAFRH